jgi:four helix bundle protein
VKKEEKVFDLKKRSYDWSLGVIELCESLPTTGFGRVINSQLLRSATSVVANITEGKSGLSKKDFVKCYGISLKKCNESHLWLQHILDKLSVREGHAKALQEEAEELAKILASIIIKSRKTLN